MSTTKTDTKPTPADTAKLLALVANRAARMDLKHNKHNAEDLISWEMTIYHGHRAIPMDLEYLLGFDDFNFAHDVFGLRRHLNRETLKVENCFVPRSAKKKGGAA